MRITTEDLPSSKEASRNRLEDIRLIGLDLAYLMNKHNELVDYIEEKEKWRAEMMEEYATQLWDPPELPKGKTIKEAGSDEPPK